MCKTYDVDMSMFVKDLFSFIVIMYYYVKKIILF